MGNIISIFKAFYEHYDSNAIRRAYGTISQRTLFSGLYQKVPFSVEIRMKKDVFAMQLNTDSIVSMELMTVIGFFFDKYSEARNCVWTKNPQKIKKFFNQGISEFIEFGGEITLNLTDDSIQQIVNMLQKNMVTSEIHKRLVENFKLLENKNWVEYEEYIENTVLKVENEKHVEEVTCMDLPLDWTNVFSSDERATDISAESPADGLVLSLNNLGRVDIEYIAQITGLSYKEVITALKGSIYQNPDSWNECFYIGWETADEYLSGRVVDKLKKAKRANEKYNGYFSENIDALKKVIPKSVSVEDIYVTLGSPWVPHDVIDNFIAYLFQDYEHCSDPKYKTFYDEVSGVWKIPKKNRYSGRFIAEETYGTKRLNTLHIIEKTLNMKTVFVTDEVKSLTNKSGKKRKLNKAETMLALEKQKLLIEKFREWVWKEPARKEALHRIYDEKYCSSVIRHYDGSFLNFPQMSPDEELYDYQKNAVARIMSSANTLLAHDVGAGKTFEMIAAGMEMRRIGISKKNLYVVPNTLTGQWREMFERLYPSSNVLCIEPNSFTGEKRQEVLKNIRDNDYDAIIIAYSSFELIPVSKDYYRTQLQAKISEITDKATETNKVTAAQSKKREALQNALKELESAMNDEYEVVYFDDLGINTMFVDEAHNFKNVPIETKINRVLGVSSAGSAKCQDMMDKVRVVQKMNNGRGIVFATGTPISNSLTDIFVTQKYLQSGELALLGLQNFDSWVGMFAERSSEFEIDVDASNFRVATRFTKFHNMPELSTLLSSVSDFYQVDKNNGIPETNGYKDIIVAKTPEFITYLQSISQRADDVRNRRVSPEDDNMLKITTDGRKAALDIRLVDNSAGFNYQCKAAFCAENVFDIYHKTLGKKLTQLIFCDTSTPKASFNLYDELKRLLTSMGVPEKDIAYIHDAVSEKKREELFEKVRIGEIRILIGSTFKLGLGVNVQDKLFALHHLDVPWRPSDMVQREGRILRNGNQNDYVDIYRYIAEGSFDAYSWQILESKQRMISAILSGCVTQRMCEEIADVVLNYAEVKAISVGNPLLKKRVELANELVRNLTLQRRMVETRQEIEIELIELPGKIEHQEKLIEKCVDDVNFSLNNEVKYDKVMRKELRMMIHDAIIQNELSSEEFTVCSYRGFDVVIPTNMTKQKPFVYLERMGRYRVDMSLSETGTLVRLDNFIDNIVEHRDNLVNRLNNLKIRESEIREELQTKDSYADIIDELKNELKRIDNKLGVDKK